MKRKWNEKDLEQVVEESFSLKEVLEKLNLTVSGSGYKILRKHIRKLKLNTSHWICKINLSGKRSGMKLPLSEIFILNSDWSAQTIRRRILRDNLIEYKCSECELSEWRGTEISLQLDHTNGNRKDNRLENLRWLCPNCHSQTKTWGAKSRKKHYYCKCGKEICKGSKHCQSCNRKLFPVFCKNWKTKIIWPDTKILLQMVKEANYSAVGRKLGVSDNAIRKRIKNHGPIV